MAITFEQASDLLKLVADKTGGPQDQEVLINKFIPNFRMFANLDRSLYFPNFFSWMGEIRELSAAPVLRQIGDLATTGKWGLVTNNASLQILGETMGEDNIIEARIWTAGSLHGPANSTMEIVFEWVSWADGGPIERIALGRMKTTWVEVLAHGLVRPEKFPPLLHDFMSSMEARNDAPDTLRSLPEPLRNVDMGEVLFQAKNGPRAQVFLTDKSYETSLYDSNLVGNLYFANYSMWMAKLREAYFFALAPNLYRGIGEQGTLKCLSCNIDHLREGMPFDTIYATMSLQTLYRTGADLYFEFFKKEPDGRTTKLAFGNHKAIWMVRDASGKSVPSAMPKSFADTLLAAANRDDTGRHRVLRSTHA